MWNASPNGIYGVMTIHLICQKPNKSALLEVSQPIKMNCTDNTYA